MHGLFLARRQKRIATNYKLMFQKREAMRDVSRKLESNCQYSPRILRYSMRVIEIEMLISYSFFMRK